MGLREHQKQSLVAEVVGALSLSHLARKAQGKAQVSHFLPSVDNVGPSAELLAQH